MNTPKKIAFATALLLAGGFANAALTSDEIKQLETTLTPWGAIKAGNKEGTIPPYEGGLPATTSPAGFKPDSGFWSDPYADEKPLYTITAKNMGEYADKLSEVTKEMLRRFPTFYVAVYPTRRSVNYPKSYIENTKKNYTRCKTIENELAVDGCFGGLPFPIAHTGYEQMWNTILGYKVPIRSYGEAVYVDETGTPIVAARQDVYSYSPYNDQKLTAESFYADWGQYTTSSALQLYPSRIAGDGTTVLWYVNPIKQPNIGFNYQQGNRRVRMIPDAQYDFPILVSGGAQFFDESYLFSGKMDRFDFKYLGKKEMFIPNNNYRFINTSREDMASVGGGHHPNPAAIRWELHRVNVVEGTLKPGMRHAFAKRRLYTDEDNSLAGMTDSWDHAGKIFKGYFSTGFWMYDKQAWSFNPTFVINLATGVIYYTTQTANGTRGLYVVDAPPRSFYTPEGLARRSQR